MEGASRQQIFRAVMKIRLLASWIALTAIILAGFAPLSDAAIVNIKSPPYSAMGDGVTDDRAAFATALAALSSGDTLLVPAGVYRLVLTGILKPKAGTSILGEGNATTLSLENGGLSTFRQFMALGGSDTLINGITVVRAADFPLVVFSLVNNSSGPSGITVRNTTIVGNRDIYPSYCHGFQYGQSDLNDVLLENLTVTTCTNGLFRAGSSAGDVAGITVTRSSFFSNYSTDLQFNSPNGVTSDVVVQDCHFRDNRCTSAGSGFAVGFAHVTNGLIADCIMDGYNREPIHVEDRSSGIVISGNVLRSPALLGGSAILIISKTSPDSATNGVTITNNLIDARDNALDPYLVLVTAGNSTGQPVPLNVSVENNILINSATTRTWYLQTGSGPAPSGNIIHDPTP
ncbi:hypothetical protein OpiT1DRAFT_04157 [Opitutaceae bacterium TAV1]|nr:hypothetical protein OpiT1DRAFT_04157 [Opitutaceae bacterium TAV1]